MTIQLYNESHKEDILSIFRLNTPEFFSEDEASDLQSYLENELELYYVITDEKETVGCGGINFSEDKTEAFISWDILHPNHQGKGHGSKLLQYRIDKIHTFKEVKRIIVRTSQVVYPFYEKNGFQLLETKKDYWAPGFDLHYMEYKKQ